MWSRGREDFLSEGEKQSFERAAERLTAGKLASDEEPRGQIDLDVYLDKYINQELQKQALDDKRDVQDKKDNPFSYANKYRDDYYYGEKSEDELHPPASKDQQYRIRALELASQATKNGWQSNLDRILLSDLDPDEAAEIEMYNARKTQSEFQAGTSKFNMNPKTTTASGPVNCFLVVKCVGCPFGEGLVKQLLFSGVPLGGVEAAMRDIELQRKMVSTGLILEVPAGITTDRFSLQSELDGDANRRSTS